MRLTFVAALIALAGIGCDAAPVPEPPTQPPRVVAPSSGVSPTHSGTLSGRVVWAGAAPRTEPVYAHRSRPGGPTEWLQRPAPNVPVIDPASGGVAGAAVFLRGIDPTGARTWDHPPVTVELHDERPMVRQGDGPPRSIGFVRRGDAVTLVARQTLYHSVRARGAAFWSLTFPEADRPRVRRLDQPGLVELSSGAGYYWMHAYLWVSEHPYCALTDATGRWQMMGVPPGEYELVVWHPNWHVERVERDPESGMIARRYFHAPLERVRRVHVRDGAVAVEPVMLGDAG